MTLQCSRSEWTLRVLSLYVHHIQLAFWIFKYAVIFPKLLYIKWSKCPLKLFVEFLIGRMNSQALVLNSRTFLGLGTTIEPLPPTTQDIKAETRWGRTPPHTTMQQSSYDTSMYQMTSQLFSSVQSMTMAHLS